MHQAISKLARAGVFMVAIMIVPAVLPASAQSTNSNHMNSNTAMSDQNGMVPGTGLTLAELHDLGYSQQQISDIQTGTQQANTGSAMGQNGNTPITSNAETGASMPGNNGANAANANQPNNAATNGNTQANNGGGGGGWGLWGLVGLLGLLGLGRGRRTETVRTDRDRDVRRVA